MSETITQKINTVEERERKQFEKMTQTPIPRLVVSLGIPTMLNMMVTSLYNLADTYFVSGLGEQATGAVNVVLSLMSIIQAVGFTLGMGAGSIVSKLLGQRKQKEADTVASSAFFAPIRFLNPSFSDMNQVHLPVLLKVVKPVILNLQTMVLYSLMK